MDDAPLYSPTATSGERGRLPHDFRQVSLQGEEDPLDSLSRSKAATTIAGNRLDSLTGGPSSELDNSLSRYVTSPPTLLEPPPDYAPLDALARSFRLEAPLVYATKTSSTPRYQLMQEFTRSGRPKMLSIRRLMASESRSQSLPSSSLEVPRIRYDEDGTMYTITSYEMRGHRSSTLGGSIKLETGLALLGGKCAKIWHLTKNKRRDSLNPENEARMLKHGYRASDEWDKRLLFSIKKGIWLDKDGKQVAIEQDEKERSFEVLGNISGPRKDLMVSCWMMRIWMVEGLRWENDVKGW